MKKKATRGGRKPEVQVHVRGWRRMPARTKHALGEMIRLAVEAMRRGDFDKP